MRTPKDELLPTFSPDGRWIAYRSNESGSNEIYVRPFPDASRGKWQVSTGGGLYAFWSNNGRELFYETADNRIMVADYSVDGGTFVLKGKPRPWSDRQLFYPGTSNLDLAPNGKRFAVLALPETPPGEKGTVHVTMLLNFFDELKRRIPASEPATDHRALPHYRQARRRRPLGRGLTRFSHRTAKPSVRKSG